MNESTSLARGYGNTGCRRNSLSAPGGGEGRGEVGLAEPMRRRNRGSRWSCVPHLTLTLSAPKGGEGNTVGFTQGPTPELPLRRAGRRGPG